MDKNVYPTEVRFNVANLIRGMNAFNTTDKLVGAETVVHDLLVVGQTDPTQAEIFRVMVIYLHLPSNTLGVQAVDITRELLEDLQLVGAPSTADAA